jgi:3-mercaptopyruvate sulfurtransferase SseA
VPRDLRVGLVLTRTFLLSAAEPWTEADGGWSMREVSRQEVQDLMARGAQVVDALPAEEYQDDHLPGAIHLPLRRIETEATTVLDPSRPVVVYCWDSA